MVHPMPMPSSDIKPHNKNNTPKKYNQKLILFKRGKIISGKPHIIGAK